MFKKFSTIVICILVLLSLAACSTDNASKNNSETKHSEISSTNDTSKEESDSTETTSATTSTENTLGNDSSTDSEETSKPIEETSKPIEETSKPMNDGKSVFKTEDAIRITFYKYYGNGKGSDVPAEHFDEIVAWLDSFEVDTDRKFPEIVPPGTNTIYVEIEYSDGSIVKKGMDTTVVNGVRYYIKGNTPPDCYNVILSKASLE